MSLFDFLNPFVPERYYEQRRTQQKSSVPRFFQIMSRYDSRLNEPRPVKFFFYGKTMGDAISLRQDLQKLGYEVYGIENSVKSRLSIAGVTPPMSLEETDFKKWVGKMNDLGFINDCCFDGWGILTILQD